MRRRPACRSSSRAACVCSALARSPTACALGAKLLVDGLVDRLYWVQAPVWLGEAAVPAFPGMAAAPLAAAPRWIPVERRALGPDTLLVLDKRICLPGL